MENISTLEDSTNIANLVLFKNRFSNDGSYFARVSRNNATFNNLISEVSKDNPGVNPFLIQYSAILLQKKILEMLSQGKAVNLLDVGTLYITYRCRANGTTDAAVNGSFAVKFTPSAVTKEKVSNLNVAAVTFADNSPCIEHVTSLPEGESDVDFSTGQIMRVSGNYLKTGGSVWGIWVAPVDSKDLPVEDESKWLKISEGSIIRNKPKELNFKLPDTVSPGKYCIVVRTSIRGNTELKVPLTGHSYVINIS